ncbi:MAG: hypothetical protein ACRDLL_01935 [Solirubrobacterales bacterium]
MHVADHSSTGAMAMTGESRERFAAQRDAPAQTTRIEVVEIHDPRNQSLAIGSQQERARLTFPPAAASEFS